MNDQGQFKYIGNSACYRNTCVLGLNRTILMSGMEKTVTPLLKFIVTMVTNSGEGSGKRKQEKQEAIYKTLIKVGPVTAL